ncbi:hypothetical protein N658DRAFT_465460 [Parathielavia hyrcaniae]|uniref:Rhomboid family membrane protein n=1 Tax=Parathielavia hyrcaniae TaxID=113614 RepID=A0AAN6Q588_9PEZI|nr:hypothetical protein N658DRAFT_465460 [Parathielavia hyrcaniae]
MSPESSPPPPPSSPPSSPSEPPLPTPNAITHNAAIAMAIICPLALLLPTRGGRAKSTLQNAVLGSAAFWGFNTLAHDYTGKSITARSSERWGALFGSSSSSSSSPRGDREKEGGLGEGTETGGDVRVGGLMGHLPTERAARNRALMEAERKRRAEAEGREYVPKSPVAGGLERWWMGGETEGWKERRLEEERRALESGKGYGGLIVDQIKEVWSGEGKKGGRDGDGEGKRKKE